MTKDEERRERLAAALRANLRRRKDTARDAAAVQTPRPPADQPENR